MMLNYTRQPKYIMQQRGMTGVRHTHPYNACGTTLVYKVGGNNHMIEARKVLLA